MKNYIILFCLLIIFTVPKANGQNYLINFTGFGKATTVSTVKVENLTKGTSLTLNGSDILRLTTTTGINSIKDNQSSELKIYPNPMTDNATLEIFPPVEGNAIISVYDMTGKPVAQIKIYLEISTHSFRLSGISNGFYLINIKGNNYQFSGKLLSYGKSNGTISIVMVNSIIQAVDEKPAKTDTKGTLATVDMAYTTGDRMKFTGISGNYSTIKMDIPTSDKTINFNFIACTDGDNNAYSVVKIGSQIWMAENLKTTKYNDGTAIPIVTDGAAWGALETPGYCWYNNDAVTYKVTYGALYNLYMVSTGNLCPTGWHVPSDEEWTTLETYLGGWDIAGGKLKESGYTHWHSPNTGATNESGFTALPGGFRYRSSGTFGDIGGYGYWWSSSEDNNISWRRLLLEGYSVVDRSLAGKGNGFSVRCLQGEVQVLPVLTTTAVSSITQTTASSGGIVTSDGGAAVTARGVCWSTTANPTIANNKTTDGTGTGTFTSNITGLTPGTTYHVRAYAVNDAGAGYGADVSFKPNYANCIPSLISPLDGVVLDNGCSDLSDVRSWTFDWVDCDGATSYNIYVKRTTSSNPTINQIITESNYTDESTGYIIDANRLGWTWKVRALVNGVWGEWSNERAFDIEPLNIDCSGNLPSGVAYMFQRLETEIPKDITYLQSLIERNPGLATQIQAKIDMLQTPNLANDIVEGDRYAADNVISIDGGNISLSAVFPLENMRADANQTIASVKLALPLLETFVKTPYPSNAFYEWYGFIMGNYNAGHTIEMEDKETYEARTGPDRLLYEDILYHELSHIYIGHEILNHFLPVYLYNVIHTGSYEIQSWIYFEGPYTAFAVGNSGLQALLDIYQLIGHDGMMKAFKILASIHPPYGSPLSTECKQAFIDQAPDNLKEQVVAKVESID